MCEKGTFSQIQSQINTQHAWEEAENQYGERIIFKLIVV